MFKITRKGIYTVPGWGRLVATDKVDVTPERLLVLYLDRGFPWIEPVLNDATLKWLKKQKLTDQQVTKLIQQAKTVEEIEFLLKLTTNKTVGNLAEKRIASLKEK